MSSYTICFWDQSPIEKHYYSLGEHLIAKKKKKIGDGENEEGKNKQNDNRQNVKGLRHEKYICDKNINIVYNIYIKNIFDLLKIQFPKTNVVNITCQVY